MENIIINPDNYKNQYIQNLNECFKGWGGDREYKWVFERQVGPHHSDILLIENKEDGVIAGSGVSYRQLSNPENSIDIGIMTGSWTLPAARRKGCFTKMINSSKELCRKNEVPFLTAFVTDSNPSSRRLRSEGSFMHPTYHLFSPEVPFKDSKLSAELVDHGVEEHRRIFHTVEQRQSKYLNFQYNFQEFVGQYLQRIKPTTILKIGEDYAILEDGINEIKVLLFTYSDIESLEENMKIITNWCLENKDKKAFFFSTRKQVFEVAGQLGFENLPGYFTILNSFNKEISYERIFENLNINMADKM